MLFKRDSCKEESQKSPDKASYILVLSQPSCMSNKIPVIPVSLLTLISKIPYSSLVFTVSNLWLLLEKGLNNTFRLDVTRHK